MQHEVMIDIFFHGPELLKHFRKFRILKFFFHGKVTTVTHPRFILISY